jgi:hypothetical protein
MLERIETYNFIILALDKIINYLKTRMIVTFAYKWIDQYEKYKNQLSFVKDLQEKTKAQFILGKSINQYLFVSNIPMTFTDLLGLDNQDGKDEAVGNGLDQLLDIADEATKGGTNRVVKLLKLVKQLRDGLDDIKDPKKKAEAKKVLDEYDKLGKNWGFAKRTQACGEFYTYMGKPEYSCTCLVICNLLDKEIKKSDKL